MSSEASRPEPRSQDTLGPSALPTSRMRPAPATYGLRAACSSDSRAWYHQYRGWAMDAEPTAAGGPAMVAA